MTIAYPKPFISQLICNLHQHTARQQQRNQQGAPTGEPYYGLQVPLTVVTTDLWLANTNIGNQKFTFGPEATPAALPLHTGLPATSDIATPAVVKALVDAMTVAINAQMPEFDASDDGADAGKVGPKVVLRINRIEAVLPWGRPAEQVVAAMVGVYMDEEYAVQVPDVDFVVLFCNDAFVVNRAGAQPGQTLTPDAIAQLRKANNWLSLAGLMSVPAVQGAVAGLGANFFTALQQGVPAYGTIDVTTVMTDFLKVFASMIQAPAPEKA